METTINALQWARKLRAVLAKLQKKRQSAVRAHRAAVVKWRRELVTWVRTNAERRVASLSVDSNRRRYGSDDRGFSSSAFFVGAPPAPRLPDADHIREIQKTLRYIAVTGVKNVHVSREDVARLLGDDE